MKTPKADRREKEAARGRHGSVHAGRKHLSGAALAWEAGLPRTSRKLTDGELVSGGDGRDGVLRAMEKLARKTPRFFVKAKYLRYPCGQSKVAPVKINAK